MFEMSYKGYNEFDKIHTRFSKFTLGVHSKSSNFAVQSELGQFPLIISCISACLNFWVHVINSKNDTLVSKAYHEQITSSRNKYIWSDFVKNVLYDLGFSHVWDNQSTFNSSSLLLSIRNKLKERYISFWKKRMNSNVGMDKLRTYKLFKEAFRLENYLEVLDRKHRRCLTAFRISAHNLQIERGRYLGKKVEERLCTICNVVEDEVHFFFECSKFQMQRNIMYHELTNQGIVLGNDSKENFSYIMSKTDCAIIKSVSRYLYDCQVI